MERRLNNRSKANTIGTRPAISCLKATRTLLTICVVFQLLHACLTTLVPAGKGTAQPRLSHAALLRESATQAWKNMTSSTNRDCAVECVTKLFSVVAPTQVPDASHITLVTHGGVSKLDRILLQAKAWGGPVSAAIFVNRGQDLHTFLAFIEEEARKPRTTTTDTNNISFHLLLEVTVETGYPHNKLRNLALDMATTDYVLPVDCDFVTNPNAHEKLHRLIQDDEDVRGKLESKFLFALPPFDLFPRAGQEFATADMLLPITTKGEVIRQVQNGTMRQFYERTNRAADRFHRYPQWYNGRPPGAADSKHYNEVPYRVGMEPYVVAYRHGLPPYYEALRGFGLDKISWIWRLGEVEEYKFAVLYDFFLIHLHHPTILKADKDEGLARNEPIFEDYKEKWLAAKQKNR